MIMVAGQTYDLEQVPDLAKVKSQLVPKNWPTSAAECVRLFISTQEMLAHQLKRHLAFNWKKICEIAAAEGEDGNPQRIKIAFAFELDQSAPSVAAIAAHSLSFAVTHKTKGKPQTHDINQGDFLEELSEVLDTEAFGEELSSKTEPTEPADPAQAEIPGAEATAPDAAAPGKKKRGRPRKNALTAGAPSGT